MKLSISVFATVITLLHSGPALAYFGPGAGVTMLGALGAVLAAIAVAVWAVLYWPVRAMLRRRRQAKADAAIASENESQIADGGD